MVKKIKGLCVLLFIAIVCLLFGTQLIGVVAEGNASLNIVAHNLSFQDNVYIKYAVSVENADDVKLLVWREPQDEYVYGSQDDVLSPLNYTENVDNKECLIFDYTKLAARNMGDFVYARAYANVGEAEIYSAVSKYSILQYALNKLGKTGTETQDENLKELLKGMLEYGALAQRYFNYKTEHLVTADYYQVFVEGGQLSDGSNHGLYMANEEVTINATLFNDLGQIFYRFEDNLENSIGFSLAQSITVGTKNETYKAVYKDYSIGLEYDSNNDGTCCLCGLGDFSGENLVIPRYSPDGDLVTEIDSSAFANEEIVSVFLPKTIESIGRKAFNNCSSLTDVYFEGTLEEWDTFVDEVVGSNNAPLINATIHTKKVETFTVTFVDWNGTELKKETVKKGESATAPIDPTREGYIFAGWEKEFTSITSDIVVIAQYRELTGPTIVISKASGKKGDEVEVEFTMESSPELMGMFLTIGYDDRALEMMTTTNGEAMSKFTYTDPSEYKNGCNFMWYANDAHIADGQVLKLKFKIKDSASVGNYTITMSCDTTNTYDKDDKSVEIVFIDGCVTVE